MRGASNKIDRIRRETSSRLCACEPSDTFDSARPLANLGRHTGYARRATTNAAGQPPHTSSLGLEATSSGPKRARSSANRPEPTARVDSGRGCRSTADRRDLGAAQTLAGRAGSVDGADNHGKSLGKLAPRDIAYATRLNLHAEHTCAVYASRHVSVPRRVTGLRRAALANLGCRTGFAHRATANAAWQPPRTLRVSLEATP